MKENRERKSVLIPNGIEKFLHYGWEEQDDLDGYSLVYDEVEYQDFEKGSTENRVILEKDDEYFELDSYVWRDGVSVHATHMRQVFQKERVITEIYYV